MVRRGDEFSPPASGAVTVVMKGYDFGQMGGNYGHAGVIHEFSRVAGERPYIMWSKGEIILTPSAIGPNKVPEKNKKCACSA